MYKTWMRKPPMLDASAFHRRRDARGGGCTTTLQTCPASLSGAPSVSDRHIWCLLEEDQHGGESTAQHETCSTRSCGPVVWHLPGSLAPGTAFGSLSASRLQHARYSFSAEATLTRWTRVPSHCRRVILRKSKVSACRDARNSCWRAALAPAHPSSWTQCWPSGSPSARALSQGYVQAPDPLRQLPPLPPVVTKRQLTASWVAFHEGQRRAMSIQAGARQEAARRKQKVYIYNVCTKHGRGSRLC